MSRISARRFARLATAIGVATLTTVTVTAVSATRAGAAGAATPGITDADIASAGLGLLAFNVRNIAAEPIAEPCPVLRPDQLGWYFAQNGYTPNLAGFYVDIYFDSTVASGYPGVDCLVDLEASFNPDPAAPHYPVVGAAYLPPGVTFQDYLAPLENHTVLTPRVAGIGGEIAGSCVPTFCYLHWHRGTLVISTLVAGGRGDITLAQTEALLTAMVPDVIANLSASRDAGAATVPTTAVPVTPPTTVATPTTAAVPTTTTPPVAAPTTALPPPPTVAAPTTVFAPPPTVATPTTQGLPPIASLPAPPANS